jgi:glycosyltransferase involved in cell wall biosynthesis
MPVFPELHAVPLAGIIEVWRKKPWFIALTPAMKDNLIASGVKGDKIAVIPNGVELPPRTVAVDQESIFLYIGNFSQSAAHKGFDVLIRGWAEVVRLRPDVRMIMVGGGDVTPWAEMTEKLGCKDTIEFAGYQADVRPYLKSACCLLLPSRKEGISNALLEAQSWGIPSIVSDIPGNTEIIVHKVNGIVVPVGDSSRLAEAIVLLHDSPALRLLMGQASRERMESGFSMDYVMKCTVNFYARLLFNGQ